jgi:hypothetical protein
MLSGCPTDEIPSSLGIGRYSFLEVLANKFADRRVSAKAEGVTLFK